MREKYAINVANTRKSNIIDDTRILLVVITKCCCTM